jgi:hypothetical protein
VAKTEFAVTSGFSNPPAVDVAWLREEDQVFPLMIFEVESRATSSVANNAQKVFAQTSNEFEKPLFFFHVFLSGKRSSRLKTLQTQYGTYNYRHYSLDAGECTKLIIDVLNQHRRLSPFIRIGPLIEVLSSDPWDEVDCHAILRTIENASFEVPYSSVYAWLYLDHQWILPHFLRRIAQDPWEGGYDSYLGGHWRVPIHLALLANSQPERGPACLQELVEWQERSSYMTQIGPHFGLSRDYDYFILGFAPALWALVAGLMRDVPGACAYVVKQNRTVLDALGTATLPYSIFTAVWLLHLSAASDSRESFEAARQYINCRGGINREFLLNPPGYIFLEEPSDSLWIEGFQVDAAPVDELTHFRTMISCHDWPSIELFRLGIEMLVLERGLESIGPFLLASLYKPFMDRPR